VTLTFSEDVKVAFGGVKVFDSSGARVDDGAPASRDHEVRVRTDGHRQGTWAVSWRVVSADGHPIRGAYTFDVGSASSGGDALARAKDASRSSPAKDRAFALVRSLVLLGLALGAGGGIFACFVAPGLRPRLAVAGLVGLLLALAVGMVLDAAIAGGFSLGSAMRWSVLHEESTSTWGRAAVVRGALALACLVVVLAWRRIGPWVAASRAVAALVALPFLALAGSQALAGHAVSTSPVWLRLPLDALHAIAAAAWIGGLVQLVLLARSGAGPAGNVVRRFSQLALGCVVVLVVTGLYAAWVEIGWSWAALSSTAYGRLVLAKSVLLVAVLPLANVNRTRNVPAVVAADGAGGGGDVATARASLARYATGELAVLLGVLAITGVLVGQPPARTVVAAKRISASKVFGDGARIQVEVDPARTGRNAAHLYLLRSTGQPDERATDMTLSITNPKRGIGPLRIALSRSGPGHWTTPSFAIPFDGRWRFDVAVTIGEFESRRASFTRPVAPARVD
jgi:copper transport protein